MKQRKPWNGPRPISASIQIFKLLLFRNTIRKQAMPKGPKGEKRPADVIANAVKVMRIATGEEEEDLPTPEKEGKDPAAVSMGKRGGKARAEKHATPERRAEIAKKAAEKRWTQ